jgi:glycosyltransferase involved in cell wall biosynthesis
MQDLLARGLAELGHDVRYLLRRGCDTRMPDGVRLLSDPEKDIDIYQSTAIPGVNHDVTEFIERLGLPWVLTCHLDRSRLGEESRARDNWIFVARSLARAYGRDRWILNGIDPADCSFSAAKDDFVLFMSSLERAITKGLETAIAVAKLAGVRLVVAGTAGSYDVIDRVAVMCRDAGVDYVGDVRGSAKADLMAAAKSLILPTQANEGCPLTLIEALMSGTPVIASTAGGIPEVVGPDTGFLCTSDEDYVRAIGRLDEISPDRCREHAIERFHYLRMARDYVREFELEIARHHHGER